MSLVNQQVGSYRLVRKVCANQNYQIYRAVHIRSSEERIIQLAQLEGKLKKKQSRKRIKEKVTSLRAINSPHVSPILKCDFTEIKGKKYFYSRTPCFLSGSLKEWVQLREKAKSLSQQDVDDIMGQAREAVEVFHKSGIAHLNLDLSSFIIEPTENPNRPRIFLNYFLPAVLSTERIRQDKVKRKQALTEDQNALEELEKLLNQNVEEKVIQPAEDVESPLKILERRLAIAEEEKEQLQHKLRELEEEKEGIIRELQEQRALDTKLLAETTLMSSGVREANVVPIASSGGSSSRSPGRRFWARGVLIFFTVLLAGAVCLLAGFFFFGKPVWTFFGSSSAKVEITQAAYKLTDNYVFTGMTHSISKAKIRSITVPATNLVFIPGSSATGTLTFHNTRRPCNVPRVIPAGTVFTGAQGISVVTNQVAILGASCNATAAAHALKIGLAGNIGIHAMKQTYHTTIIVDNPAAFVGGQFNQSYTTVQRSDIDQASSNLTAQLIHGARYALYRQLQKNERFVSSPTCKARVTSDHQVNDAATTVTVTVTVTCTAEVYNSQEILSRSEQMINERAQALFSTNYILTGAIKSEISHVATDVKHGTLITVVASGLWTYQFKSAHAEQVARLITGKDKHDSQSILSNQKGVQSVSINISNNDSTMPNDANSIKIAYVTSLVPIQEGAASLLS